MPRPNRPIAPRRSGPLLGALLELEIGEVAHGGHCVARHEGRVIFVRHALPGERVLARVTEDGGGSYARADAIEVRSPSPNRVTAPCPHAGPGRCGGCDWQHADITAQRRLKADVVREQFARLAQLDVEVDVEELPGGPLGWRTRIGFAVDERMRLGLLRHRSRTVEAIETCPLGAPGVNDAPLWAPGALSWAGESRVEVVLGDDGQRSVLGHRPGYRPGHREVPRARSGVRHPSTDEVELMHGPAQLHHVVLGLPFDVAAGGFWQVHPGAAPAFAAAVLAALAPRRGESALDLYAGAGLFTAMLARAVGPNGRVVGLESDPQAVIDAAASLRDAPWAEVRQAQVTARTLAALDLDPELVVLDPPRAGAGAAVMSALLEGGNRVLRAVAYVACDPASLARDVATARNHGWQLRDLRAFDAFPMTHHVECIATLTSN